MRLIKSLTIVTFMLAFIIEIIGGGVMLGPKTAWASSVNTPLMVFVKGGSFTMGDNGRPSTSPARTVTVRDFFIGKYEVTCNEYIDFCEATGRQKPFYYEEKLSKNPVTYVSWYDAVAYCNWLSSQYNLRPAYAIEGKIVSFDNTANGYRLPTEAEWEYAARGGKKSKGYKYSGSDNVAAVAWYKANSAGTDGKRMTHPVGQKKPNELGLYDMSGNVWEWCWDWYGDKYYSQGGNDNPTGPEAGEVHVQRGGCAFWEENYTQVTTRGGYFWGDWGNGRTYCNRDIGFRIARTEYVKP